MEPVVPIEGYRNTVLRNPRRAPFAAPVARGGAPSQALALGPGALNLAEPVAGRPALGQLIHVSGRVCDAMGRPVAGAVLEIWQANAAGRYAHPNDRRDAPLDPNFLGHGRCVTDAEGRWSAVTIKPGAYPVPDSGRWWRPPHIHVSVLGPGALDRLVTQMYFPGEPLNAWDRLLLSVPDAAAQARMVAVQVPPAEVEGEWLAYTHELVLG